MNKNWESVYIYYSGEGDVILKNLVKPYVDQLRKYVNCPLPFFFVRYFENGYHIRLRLWLDSHANEIAHQLLEEIVRHYNCGKDGSVFTSYIPYVPETDRYGNADTLQLAEQQFGESSKTILDWLSSCEAVSLPDRYLQALKLHIAFFKGTGLSIDHALMICDQFIQGWLPRLFVKDIPISLQSEMFLKHFESEYRKYEPVLMQVIPAYWDALSKPDGSGLDNYLLTHKTIFSAYKHAGIEKQKINEILGSFMHMTNNRLGISNRDEAFIIYLVKKSILILLEHENNK